MPAQLDPNWVVGLVMGAFCLLDVLFAILFALSLGKERQPAPPEPSRKPGKKSSSIAGVVVAVVFMLGWSLLTLLGDIGLLRGAVRQLRALDYPTAEGEVVKCRV